MKMRRFPFNELRRPIHHIFSCEYDKWYWEISLLQMGIPRFFGQFIARLPGDIVRKLIGICEGICVDMNGTIHDVAQQVYGYDKGAKQETLKRIATMTEADLEKDFFMALATRLDELIATLRPRQYVILCVDGVAPRAKINQQRSRRFRPAPPRPIGIQPQVQFNPSVITPGTPFMMRLDNYLQHWIVLQREKFPNVVVYSPHSMPGEGEHKMFHHLRKLLTAGTITQGQGNHVIYGLDADLTMLAALSPLKNIYLCRENLQQNVSIDALMATMTEAHVNLTPSDFVTVIFLIGNDFLPHIPALVSVEASMDAMFTAYNTVGVPLTTAEGGGGIDWPHMARFLVTLAGQEQALLRDRASLDYMYPFTLLLQSTTRVADTTSQKDPRHRGVKRYKVTSLDFDAFRNNWYLRALPGSRNLDRDIAVMARRYLKAMEWVLAYYQGKPVSQHYTYPFTFAPLLIDLAIAAHNMAGGEVMDEAALAFTIDIGPHEGDRPITFVHQLLSVLPSRSADLVPEPFNVLIAEQGLLSDMCPLEFATVGDGINEAWETVPLLPPPNLERVFMEVDQLARQLGVSLPMLPGEDHISITALTRPPVAPRSVIPPRATAPREGSARPPARERPADRPATGGSAGGEQLKPVKRDVLNPVHIRHPHHRAPRLVWTDEMLM